MSYITSSNGTLFVEPDGTVDVERSTYETPSGEAGDLRPIVRFDIEEWKRTYPGREFNGGDILDFGYWFLDEFGNEHYEPPVQEWREEFR